VTFMVAHGVSSCRVSSSRAARAVDRQCDAHARDLTRADALEDARYGSCAVDDWVRVLLVSPGRLRVSSRPRRSIRD
jgi:hypothetical protein